MRRKIPKDAENYELIKMLRKEDKKISKKEKKRKIVRQSRE